MPLPNPTGVGFTSFEVFVTFQLQERTLSHTMTVNPDLALLYPTKTPAEAKTQFTADCLQASSMVGVTYLAAVQHFALR